MLGYTSKDRQWVYAHHVAPILWDEDEYLRELERIWLVIDLVWKLAPQFRECI